MKNITVSEIKKRLDNGEKLNIIDVRETGEYAEDNIGAILLPLSKLRNFETDSLDGLEEEEVLVHCKSGKRSIEAALILEQLGFKNVVNVEGGISAWRAQIGAANI